MARWLGHIALTGAAIAAVGLALSPAIGSRANLPEMRANNPVSLVALGSISSFTPTTKDPRLAAAYAKAALGAGHTNFRFTPTSGSLIGQRSVTVLVRADGKVGTVRTDRTIPAVGITPVAFSLDVAPSWRKFALAESVGRKELDPIAADTLNSAKGFSLEKPKKTRFSTTVQASEGHHDLSASTSSLADRNYSIDVGSSYSLTRNLNVTAGVRYSGANARLAPLTDDRQDSQAVYLGTVFKF
ncbi:MAG: hypothetical protein DI547_10875 [Sphingobium sp.]|nr:MAG: hypothetical protein DI547_10875 [Sphingobium sp.]